VSGDPHTISAARIVRGRVDIGRLSWVRPLVPAYERDYDSVASFFAGNPRDPQAWAQTIARVAGARRDAARMAALADAQLARRGAPADARANAARLADPATVAVVTGQQAGLFGGPLYTLLKAVTAIQLARQVAGAHGVPVVPVFWVASEDHDWAEVRSTLVLDQDLAVRSVAAPDVAGAGVQSVGALAFDDRIAGTVEALAALLPQTAWTADLVAELRTHYRPGSNLGAAMAGWLDRLFGHHGLVVFDGADPDAKPLVADLFVAELDAPERTAGEVRTRGDALRALGHNPQVIPAEHATALFYLDETGRHPIRYVDGAFEVGRRTVSQDELRGEAASHPERFSPNVMLRPIVQDRLLPTICYVTGPGELAYQAQFGGVYAAFGVERPLFASRASVTVLDPPTVRFLDRYDLPFEDLEVGDDSVLNGLVSRVLAPDVGPAVAAMEQALADRMAALKDAAVAVDQTLAGAADTTLTRMRHALDDLHRKIVRAAKRRDEALRRQFEHARTVAFPNGIPQERALGVAALLNQYGPALVDQLVDELPTDAGHHYLVAP
jgi:bacillithiol biosynthesis cysteine-adding enzyme BshC